MKLRILFLVCFFALAAQAKLTKSKELKVPLSDGSVLVVGGLRCGPSPGPGAPSCQVIRQCHLQKDGSVIKDFELDRAEFRPSARYKAESKWLDSDRILVYGGEGPFNGSHRTSESVYAPKGVGIYSVSKQAWLEVTGAEPPEGYYFYGVSGSPCERLFQTEDVKYFWEEDLYYATWTHNKIEKKPGAMCARIVSTTHRKIHLDTDAMEWVED